MSLSEYLSLDELHKIAAETLSSFDAFCADNNLRYWMIDGTLLGAVRHKGFIPWDDDVDVCMPATDYLKMMQLLKNGECLPSPYAVVSYELDDDYYRPWARVYDTRTELVYGQGEYLGQRCDKDVHPFVDVFPMIGFSEKNAKRKLQSLALKIKFRLLTLIVGPPEIQGRLLPRIIKQSIRPILRCIGQKTVMDSLVKEYAKPSRCFDKCALVALMYDADPVFWPSKYFAESIRLNFEGKDYYAPMQYHDVLANEYGDYMKLPPEKERVQVFETKVRWREGFEH